MRAAEGLAPYPTLAVITGSLRLDPAFADPAYEHGPVIVVTTGITTTRPYEPFREHGAEVLPVPGRPIELAGVLASWRRRD